MFKNQFRESIENKVRLSEYDADLIQELLRFIYLGEVQNLDTFAPQLLSLADLVSMITVDRAEWFQERKELYGSDLCVKGDI